MGMKEWVHEIKSSAIQTSRNILFQGIVVAGGSYDDIEKTDQVHLLNLDQGFWITLEPFPFTVTHMKMKYINKEHGFIYTFKGHFDDNTWKDDPNEGVYALWPRKGSSWYKVLDLPESCRTLINVKEKLDTILEMKTYSLCRSPFYLE